MASALLNSAVTFDIIMDDRAHQALCAFADAFYGKVIESQEGKLQNVFLSPLSIFAAMSMTMAGSRSKTLEEMIAVLKLDSLKGNAKMHELVGTKLEGLFKGCEGVDLAIGNRLFAQHDADIKAEFTQLLLDCYKAEAEKVDFAGNTEAARMQINTWIKNQTRLKIPELFAAGSLLPNTCAIIANAIYFKGKWANQFDKSHTRDGEFTLLDGSKVPVKNMFIENTFPLANLESINAEAVKMPFLGLTWEMIIVLPNDVDGLPKLLGALKNSGGLSSVLTANFFSESVNLHLPRFKLGEGEELNAKRLLMASGMQSLFIAEQADLCGISSSKLFVSDVRHKAILEVDEEGATAAAATAFMNEECCMMPDFNVDHPFVVMLVSDQHVPVFVGHVTNPVSQ